MLNDHSQHTVHDGAPYGMPRAVEMQQYDDYDAPRYDNEYAHSAPATVRGNERLMKHGRGVVSQPEPYAETSLGGVPFPGNSSNCVMRALCGIVGLTIVTMALLLGVGFYDYSSNTEEATQITFALNMIQRSLLMGTRATALCLASKQIQCAADGLDATACAATLAQLDALCPIPAEIAAVLSVSDVESALSESSQSDDESLFASQQEELAS
jgi:hypothetical protein